jgi:Transposase DDE domain group 1
VFERYGRQQGSLKGYNPRKHGRTSHHPLLALLAEAKLVLHAWLRSGNTASARGVKAFLAETLAKLPPDFRLYALRADSGFFITDFLAELERRALPYVIAVRMNPHLRRTVAGIAQWTPFARGLEAAATSYQAYGWPAPRRLVVVREMLRERPEARGRKLLEVPAIPFMSWSPPLSMTRCQPGASTTAAPNAKTASRSSRTTLAPAASACTPSTAPKPFSA